MRFDGPAKSLDDGHRAAATVHDAGLSGHVAQEPEDRTHVHPNDSAAQVVIPGQLVAQTRRHTQDPLPHGHRGEHTVDQVRGAFRHAAPATARTDRAALTRKRQETIETAPRASKPGETARQIATPQKVAELLLDKSGQPFAVPQTRRLSAERLEVIADHLEQHAVRRIARPVRLGR